MLPSLICEKGTHNIYGQCIPRALRFNSKMVYFKKQSTKVITCSLLWSARRGPTISMDNVSQGPSDSIVPAPQSTVISTSLALYAGFCNFSTDSLAPSKWNSVLEEFLECFSADVGGIVKLLMDWNLVRKWLNDKSGFFCFWWGLFHQQPAQAINTCLLLSELMMNGKIKLFQRHRPAAEKGRAGSHRF